MLSKTKLKERSKKKTNPTLVETLIEARKHEAWKNVLKVLSSSTRNHASVNLAEIEKEAKDGDVVVVPGKVLSTGELKKKVSVRALSFSTGAQTKLRNAKIDFGPISEEIKKNTSAKGVKVLR